jgi:hypothetical protein
MMEAARTSETLVTFTRLHGATVSYCHILWERCVKKRRIVGLGETDKREHSVGLVVWVERIYPIVWERWVNKRRIVGFRETDKYGYTIGLRGYTDGLGECVKRRYPVIGRDGQKYITIGLNKATHSLDICPHSCLTWHCYTQSSCRPLQNNARMNAVLISVTSILIPSGGSCTCCQTDMTRA